MNRSSIIIIATPCSKGAGGNSGGGGRNTVGRGGDVSGGGGRGGNGTEYLFTTEKEAKPNTSRGIGPISASTAVPISGFTSAPISASASAPSPAFASPNGPFSVNRGSSAWTMNQPIRFNASYVNDARDASANVETPSLLANHVTNVFTSAASDGAGRIAADARCAGFYFDSYALDLKCSFALNDV